MPTAGVPATRFCRGRRGVATGEIPVREHIAHKTRGAQHLSPRCTCIKNQETFPQPNGSVSTLAILNVLT